MEIRTICILGGTGFVGSHLAVALYKQGYRLRIATRSLHRSKHLSVLPSAELRVADIHDPAQLAELCRDMDAVINLTGILHEKKKGDFERVHAELPAKLVAACRSAGVKRLLHMSALGASPQGQSHYQQSKGRGEATVREAHSDTLQITVFRPSVIYGRGDTFLNLFAELLKWSPVLPLGSPEAKIQPIAVGDVVHAFTASLENSATFGETYELCGPKVYTLLELVEYVRSTLGLTRWVYPLGDLMSYLQAFALELAPVKMLTRDNYYTLKTPAVCACPFPAVFGFQPIPLEIEAPNSLILAPSRHPRGFIDA